MSDRAYISHRSPGRLRLKIPARRGDSGYFNALEKAFMSLQGAEEIVTNPTTASVLILHQGDILPQLQQRAEAEAFFTLAKAEDIAYGASLLQQSAKLSGGLNQWLRSITRGQVDMGLIAIILLLILAFRQVQKGYVLSPAIALLWNAFELMVMLQRPRQ